MSNYLCVCVGWKLPHDKGFENNCRARPTNATAISLLVS